MKGRLLKQYVDRMGKFSIDRRTMELLKLSAINKIFKDLLVVYVEDNLMKDCFVYTAISPYFFEVKTGEMIPHYKCVIENNKVIWERIDEIKNINI